MTPKIKTLIIEDDKKASDYLSSILIKNFSQINIIGYSDSVKDSILLIDKLKPEIVFMDIMLTDGNAFQILDKITYTDFETIFVTSHTTYFEKAIAHYAFHYTLKPIDLPKVEGVLNRYDNLKKRMSSLNKYQLFSEFIKDLNPKLLIQVSNRYLPITIDDIEKCTAEGNYTFFHLKNKEKLLASKSLKHYEKTLIYKGFFKVHRSTIVNISHIKSIYKKETILLQSGEKINISRSNKANLNQLIEQLS